MKVPAQRPKQPASSNLTRASMKPAASYTIHPPSPSQCSTGNHADQQILDENTEHVEAGPDHSAVARFTYDFSRVPVFSKAPVRLQAKLTVNAPGDTHEQEAEHVADQVVRIPRPQLQRKCGCGGSCPPCQAAQPHAEHERAQTSRLGAYDSGTTVAPSVVREVLSSAGQPLDSATREFMEPRFGYDFSQVRIHTEHRASAAARKVAAQAFTVGEHIMFAEDQYAPDSAVGRHLLAHELTHVVQQRAGGPALQRRAANCPDAPPSPPTITTMDDFIALVKRVEASTMTGGDPIETARLISRTKYDTRAWDWMLPSTKGKSGVAKDPYGVGQVRADDIASLCFKLIVTMPGGGQEDPMHLIAAVVADAETQAAGTGATGLSRLVRPLPASVSQRSAVTWVGDVGKAAAYWMIDYPLKSGKTTMADYMQEDAPPHDLMSDVDGVALTSRSHATNLAFDFDPTKPLSENLQRFFSPAPRTGRERRFHFFCYAEGFALEADGVTLSAAARTTIREKVRDMALWMESADPDLFKHSWARADEHPYAMKISKRENDWQWFADQFINFVQTNLTAEGQ